MLVQKILINYYNKIIAIILTLIGGMIVSRLLGPGPIGLFSYSLSIASTFSFISDFGTWTVHIKYISEGKNDPRYLGTFLRIRVFFT